MEINIGKDDNGKDLIHSLDKNPVILMAGQTGSGKSNVAHNIIQSIVKIYNPNEIKFI